MAARPKPPPEVKSESPIPPETTKPDASQRDSAEALPGLISGAEKRTALVIGNGAYSTGPLKNPVNDATDLSANLKRLGFVVTLKKNASHQEMEDAIREFGDQLRKGGVGLFFYAGHGVQIGGRNYLLPVGARINRDTDVKFQAVDTEIVLAEMGNAGNSLNIVILDACRDNPFGKSFRTASRGLAIISDAPKGTFITYSTSPGKVAADGGGRNSPYTESLIRHMRTPGLQIEDVFKEVRKDMGRKTGGQQVPWELSSLEGQFYFHPGAVTERVATAPSFDYAAEQRKIDEEKDRLRKEKELVDQQESLAEERRRLAEKKKQIATFKHPSVSTANEISWDSRFITYDNGTVLDTNTNLVWAAKDNGSDIDWVKAKSYCEKYRGGGYTDWRMPTQDELAGLYDAGKEYKTDCSSYNAHLTDMIRLTCIWVWSSEIRGSDAAYFNFSNSKRYWLPQLDVLYSKRALPVRSLEVKKISRFIDNGNGTVTDTKTGLMWAARDKETHTNWVDGPNGKILSTSWSKARSYCENYRGGGYTDWRMPTQDELAGLYDSAKTYKTECNAEVHLTEMIHLTCEWVWASETRGLDPGQPCLSYESCPGSAALFGFGHTGSRHWDHQYYDGGTRALPVRTAK
jgi:uncharacterized caspase-like protein